MWGTIRYEHELHVGNTRWEDRIQCEVQQLGNIYIVKYGDRKSGNFGIIKYVSKGNERNTARAITGECRLAMVWQAGLARTFVCRSDSSQSGSDVTGLSSGRGDVSSSVESSVKGRVALALMCRNGVVGRCRVVPNEVAIDVTSITSVDGRVGWLLRSKNDGSGGRSR